MSKIINFKDLRVQYPDRYTLTDSADIDEIVRLKFNSGEIYQEGTPENAENFNTIQNNCVYLVDAIRTMEANEEIYDIEIENSSEFIFENLNIILVPDNTNTNNSTVIRFNGLKYYFVSDADNLNIGDIVKGEKMFVSLKFSNKTANNIGTLSNTKTDKGGYTGTAMDLKKITDSKVPFVDSRVCGIHFSKNDKIYWHCDDFDYTQFWDERTFNPELKTEKGGYNGTSKDLDDKIKSLDTKTTDSEISLSTRIKSAQDGVDSLNSNKYDKTGGILRGDILVDTSISEKIISANSEKKLSLFFNSRKGGEIGVYDEKNITSAWSWAQDENKLILNRNTFVVDKRVFTEKMPSYDFSESSLVFKDWQTNVKNGGSNALITFNGVDQTISASVGFEEGGARFMNEKENVFIKLKDKKVNTNAPLFYDGENMMYSTKMIKLDFWKTSQYNTINEYLFRSTFTDGVIVAVTNVSDYDGGLVESCNFDGNIVQASVLSATKNLEMYVNILYRKPEKNTLKIAKTMFVKIDTVGRITKVNYFKKEDGFIEVPFECDTLNYMFLDGEMVYRPDYKTEEEIETYLSEKMYNKINSNLDDTNKLEITPYKEQIELDGYDMEELRVVRKEWLEIKLGLKQTLNYNLIDMPEWVKNYL